MQIKLISFSESKLVSMNSAHEMISGKIKEATGISEEFLFCDTQKKMFTGVKEGIESADVILVAVDVSKFISTKASLFRAMGFKCRLNSDIIELINSEACMATLNENQINAHAAIPVGGEAFVSVDGLFSGFGIQSGKQKLIFIPIDEKRIETVIENGMLSFLVKGYEDKLAEEKEAEPAEKEEIKEEVSAKEEIESAEKEEEQEEASSAEEYEDIVSSSYADESAATPVDENEEQEEEADEEEPDEAEEAEEPEEAEEAEGTDDILAKISSRGLAVTFVRQTENTVYTNVLAEIADNDAVDFADFSLDKNLADDAKRKENVAANARAALKQTNASYAVAMSEIFYDENGEGYIFATLSDLQKSSVYKIFATEDETDKDLYRTGIESILEKIEETSRSVNSRPFSAVPLPEATQEKKKIPSSTLIVIWVLVIVAAVTLTALVLDMVLSNDASLASSASAIISDANNFLLR
ncbi:MAG: hypothetical protein IJ279_06905 [Clostridia bacterium]|nr:hypothetical protein [Clostridia bacterium]